MNAPFWVPRVDAALRDLGRGVRLLGAVTPVGAARERERLIARFEAGVAAEPQWSYDAPRTDGLQADLARLHDALTALPASPLVDAYAARVREIALEAELSSLAGTAALGARARERFAADDAIARRASQLAAEWSRAPAPPPQPTFRSDGVDPSSLLARMRAEVGRLRLPFEVVALRELTPLAATGERTIFVAAGRAVTEEDVGRTVLHEIEGHARPRARAGGQAVGLFALGTAGGVDDQEGYALVLEARHGHLSARRRRQLAARHRAVESMLAGASFVETVRALVNDDGACVRDAVMAAERAYRGGDGRGAGLGRERVYLEAFVRVMDGLSGSPDDEEVLGAGQVAVDAVATLRPYVTRDPST